MTLQSMLLTIPIRKTDDKKGGVSTNPQEISISKYKEMLMATVKDALEIVGYESNKK
jgi:hypothetical protein